jgi:hypothetical protein
MRRALPWVTVGLLVLGVGAGVGLGIAGQTTTPRALTATRQIARIVAATRGAETARFSYSSSNASTNRLLRGSTRGTGVVNFADDAMRTVESDQSIGSSGTSAATAKPVVQHNVTDEIWIGRTEYTRFASDNELVSLHAPWVKGATWPKDSFGPLGAVGQIGPLGELGLDESVPGFRLQDAGSGMVRGVEATQYRIVVPTCGTSGPTEGITETTTPLQLWVDSHGRLVQARMSSTEDIAKNAHVEEQLPGGGFPPGRITIVSTIDLGDFGAPTAIAAPAVVHTQSSGGSGFITLKRRNCR